ncbi:PEP-CTERM sorting domain-containing protein [Oceanicoccus sp. KOV_DT_Chl]|uniref:PEP-CTERM sorting domain-containing protein n=1 Tax=Oceanicoccus sp. KOV_DT_Chl TaxID=1904639 RepID=UPI000C7C69CB|nr:PEP-CTERM sorting domain-containing protein [Oceanicoccus sp. KOV_DT_Chl]
MFKQLIKSVIAVPALVLTCASAVQAGQIIDVEDVDQAISWSTLEYQHNINDEFPVFVPGTAISGSLSIDISDDGDRWGEGAVIVVENLDFDTGGTWGAIWGSATPGWVNDLEIEAIASLNVDGFLNVSISGLGDFYVGSSTLTVNTADVASVPEPGSLALLALGLIAVGVSRRSIQH